MRRNKAFNVLFENTTGGIEGVNRILNVLESAGMQFDPEPIEKTPVEVWDELCKTIYSGYGIAITTCIRKGSAMREYLEAINSADKNIISRMESEADIKNEIVTEQAKRVEELSTKREEPEALTIARELWRDIDESKTWDVDQSKGARIYIHCLESFYCPEARP